MDTPERRILLATALAGALFLAAWPAAPTAAPAADTHGSIKERPMERIDSRKDC
ncbi:hypothetical protein G3N55_08795 [Dissulfurirhabdus thermomarina]|uniref:Uncharacterized protein n=1 Tax=Dissulfurirhabdus thermomarina TaxID=1765737 RepID=A0A6N9TU23_DISTH|nr:hypothetical protein [Dissulfurirhabdus thermomarina]NDY42937.1 hypothetical protein [Dissulfurirhabdus thermomarina]NMX23209.1 hypothetical protein [Dissulfurirhabdus thermomarina]